MADPAAVGTVFLDRDGVINRKAPAGEYVRSWSEFEFLPGALDGIRELSDAGLILVVATNQRGIARGRMTERDLADIHRMMRERVDAAGGRIAAIYHCPHEEGECDCRKPRTGMFEQAAREVPGARLKGSAMIGDGAHDIEAARRIGAVGILVSEADAPMREADHVAPDLLAAAHWLVAQISSANRLSSSS
jgi:D-glycero-D-manno-heptose 1,7-bisphosphate phosphatase